MSTPLTPLNLTAGALSVLQTRGVAALGGVRSISDAQGQLADRAIDIGGRLAAQGASGGAIPRGQILDILA